MTIAYTLSALTAKTTRIPTLTSAIQYWTLYQSPIGIRRLDRQLTLDGEDARVVDLHAERYGKFAQHLPSVLQRRPDRDRRAQELDRAFDVRVAALALGEGRRR